MNIQKSYRYIIFDWDGTLAKTTHTLVIAYKKAFAKRGLLLRKEHFHENIFGNWEKGIRDLAVPGSKKVFEEISKDVVENLKTVDLYPGVYNMLEKLYKRNKKIGLLTLTDRLTVEHSLKFHKIDKFFDHIVTGNEVTEKKPDPRPLIKVQMGMNALYSETLYIGNSANDAVMGRNAKLTTGIYTPKENKDYFDVVAIHLAKPDFVFGDYDYLIKKIQ